MDTRLLAPPARFRSALPGLALLLAMLAAPAWASIDVRFIEGAPKDRFEITHRGACTLSDVRLVIDLAPSAAGLIFDTTATGAGVDVFQPFELVEGADALTSHTPVNDGDRQVELSVKRLAPGTRIAFTVDVDDTLGPRGITIAGSEIQGAAVRVLASGFTATGRFSAQGDGQAATPPCR